MNWRWRSAVLASVRFLAQARLFSAPLLTLGAGLIAFLRRPEQLTDAQPFAESAPVFFVPTYFLSPLEVLLTPYAGYLHVGTRLVFYLERLVGPAGAPVIGNLIAIVIGVAVAAFVASDRLAPVLPHRWQRYAFGGAVLLAPGVYEVLAIDIGIGTYLSAYLVAMAVARPPRTLGGRMVDWLSTAVASLTGPFSLILLPLFWVRRSGVTIVVTACALVQLVTLANAPTRPWLLPDAGALAEIAALRVSTAVLGPSLAAIAPAAAAVLLIPALLFVAVGAARPGAWLPFAYGAVAIGGAGVIVTGADLIAAGPRAAERYFFLAGLTGALIVIRGVSATDARVRTTARVLGMVMVMGMAVNLRVPPLPDSRWADESTCIGSPLPCRVELHPDRFSFTWPGIDGEYSAPMLSPPLDGY